MATTPALQGFAVPNPAAYITEKAADFRKLGPALAEMNKRAVANREEARKVADAPGYQRWQVLIHDTYVSYGEWQAAVRRLDELAAAARKVGYTGLGDTAPIVFPVMLAAVAATVAATMAYLFHKGAVHARELAVETERLAVIKANMQNVAAGTYGPEVGAGINAAAGGSILATGETSALVSAAKWIGGAVLVGLVVPEIISAIKGGK
jgi:hypothetical protein